MYLFGVINIIVILVIFFLGEKELRKRFHIEKRKEVTYRPINAIQKWSERMLIIVFIGFIFAYQILFNQPLRPLVYFGFLFLFYNFRAFNEWKYDRESKQYILNIYYSIMYLLFLITLEILWP